MKILLINKFLYPKGGDTISLLNTGTLLSLKGHQVLYWGMNHPLNPNYKLSQYFVSNIDYNHAKGILAQMNMGLKILYSLEARRKIETVIQSEKPDIVHLHNFAHQISPSILHVLKRYNIPSVMTMHDYKLVCACYKLLSNGRICELCSNQKHYHCFLKVCVKGSKMKSLLNMFEMYLHHNILNIYSTINYFIAPSLFLKHKLIEMGFKGELVHLPNCINIDLFTPCYHWDEMSIVYFGRLSHEKGLFTLLNAVRGLDLKLKVIGTGPIKKDLELYIKSKNMLNVELMGYKTGESLRNEITKSMAIIVASEWYENNPMTIIEAFALGKPVIGARIGGIPELIENGKTGFLYEPGNAEDLHSKIEYLRKHPDEIIALGKNARNFAEQELNSEKHYKKLIEIYEKAFSRRTTTI